MSLFIVGLNQTGTINQSETDSVSFLGLGTLSIAGMPGSPIDVTLSQVAGVGLLNTITITDANVTLDGVAGISALVDYEVGAGGTLTLANTVGIAAGSSVTFTAPDSKLVLGNGLDLGLLNGIANFAPGSTIDIGALASSVQYVDNAGTGTGGTLNLLNSAGERVAALPLTTGEYVGEEFQLSSDGNGGTLANLGIVVSGLSAMPVTGNLSTGATVKLSVATSAPVTVADGTPTLALNDGGTATYDAAASTESNLVFDYTVAPGQNTPDLAVVGVALNGATVTGSGGVLADLSGAIGNPAGTLEIDTLSPTVTGVTTDSGSNAMGAGETVAITVGVSEGVGVSGGTPTLSLNDGGVATYDPNASTSTSLVFMHTVQPGQASTDLAITGVDLNGASITDAAGNAADLSGAVVNPAGTLSVSGGSTAANTLGVYRFFDSSTGTHFFTGDASEKTTLMNSNSASYRPDLKEEVNNFGSIDPAASDPDVATVYRFFDTAHGTHFFTASQTEVDSLRNQNSATYRADLVFEPNSSFSEHSTQQAGDVAVYRFFDTTFGTHFYTGNQTEAAAIGTPGTAGYRADLVSEGIGFYAPNGSYA